MKHWKRALALGFLSWLIPFAGGFVAYPLKRVNAGLFDTAMAVILLITAALLARRYFRDVELTGMEAAQLGFLWVAINLVFDYPMFSHGPMQMSMGRYYAEIGSGYLLYPVFLLVESWVRRRA